ncbi:hypothetical protein METBISCDRAFT_24235 [Metschnikowia bicuspidata]|uniref:Mid2 domain-containing protein n=1 Tax=Metschnikowia bicuspidata TaxID=27322 RepID=A0A4P9ZA37_9ASCO|nr:hypothetical protein METBISCDRAFT_24235 [Metschnikowia bicuspidata]
MSSFKLLQMTAISLLVLKAVAQAQPEPENAVTISETKLIDLVARADGNSLTSVSSTLTAKTPTLATFSFALFNPTSSSESSPFSSASSTPSTSELSSSSSLSFSSSTSLLTTQFTTSSTAPFTSPPTTSSSSTQSLSSTFLTTFESVQGGSTIIVTQTSIVTSSPSSSTTSDSRPSPSLSSNNRIVVAVCVGVGGAVLIGFVATLIWFKRNSKKGNQSGWTFWRKSEKGCDDLFNGELGVRDRNINQGLNF